jgi:hypothetical protein
MKIKLGSLRKILFESFLSDNLWPVKVSECADFVATLDEVDLEKLPYDLAENCFLLGQDESEYIDLLNNEEALEHAVQRFWRESENSIAHLIDMRDFIVAIERALHITAEERLVSYDDYDRLIHNVTKSKETSRRLSAERDTLAPTYPEYMP